MYLIKVPWFLLHTIFLAVHLPVVLADNTAFFLHTLRTHVLFACEHEDLSIKCPEGTTISIDSANYGRQVSNTDMCAYRWSAGGVNSTDLRVPSEEDTNCRAAESLQTLISNCQDEEMCTLRVTNEIFQEDPCPGTLKYLDVTYKCRPNDFQSLVVCEHRHMQLHCEGANIIAIYSASFGRTELGSMECPSYTMHEIDCQAENSLEEVMKRCHGRRNCALKVATKVFGDPCPERTHKYLNVVYSCVSRKVFRKPRRYIGLPKVQPGRPVHPDDKPTQVIELISPELIEAEIPPVVEYSFEDSDMAIAVTDLITEVYPPDPVQGWFVSSMALANFVMDNKEPVLLSLLLGASLGLVLLLLAVVLHCQIKNWKLRRKLKTATKRHNLGSGDGLLLAVQEENRIDINELWRRPPSPLILANRTFDNQNGNRPRQVETGFGSHSVHTGVDRAPSLSDSNSTIHQVEIDSNRNTIQRVQRAPSESTTVSWQARTFASSNRSQELESNRSTLPRDSREPSEITTYHNDGTLPFPGSRPLNNYYP